MLRGLSGNGKILRPALCQLFALWTQTIDRKINYTSDESELLYEEIAEVQYGLSPSVFLISMSDEIKPLGVPFILLVISRN